jgi:hypothetical protein
VAERLVGTRGGRRVCGLFSVRQRDCPGRAGLNHPEGTRR